MINSRTILMFILAVIMGLVIFIVGAQQQIMLHAQPEPAPQPGIICRMYDSCLNELLYQKGE